MKQRDFKMMFWGQGNKKLTILNPDDFRVPAIANQLSFGKLVGTFGIADEKEIIARNELMKFLFYRPELRDKIEKWSTYNRAERALPENENSFLYFYENKNPYWAIVKDVLQEFNVSDCPAKLLPFFKNMEKLMPILEKEEKKMAEEIGAKLKMVTRMEGAIDFKIEDNKLGSGYKRLYIRDEDKNDDYKSIIIGQKAFSATWTQGYVADIPSWLNKWFWRTTGIKSLAQTIANNRAAQKARRSAVIEDFPRALLEDLRRGFCVLMKLELTRIMNRDDEKALTPEERRIRYFLKPMKSIFCKVYFSYNEQGLKIKLVNVKSVNAPYFETFSSSNANRNYNGYTKEERNKIISRLEEINLELSEAYKAQDALKITDFISKQLNVPIGTSIRINSPETDGSFRWNFLQNLYNSKENSGYYIRLTRNREYFWRGMDELMTLCRVIARFEEGARVRNLPLCMPDIRTDKAGVNFRKLAPINMIKQEDKQMVPFSFPEINGHILCLTGKHGRGKSVAGNSVLENLWLAQSGLPVFAESFSTDVKEMIGAVTNDKGEGSTATVFVQKTLNLFKNIRKVPAHKSLIFIDEIGKGTQEEAGMKLGQEILRALSKNGNSVIFNTQIMRLAEHARDNFQAICLKVDDRHQFQPGIGEGMMEDLIKEVGLDKYLVK